MDRRWITLLLSPLGLILISAGRLLIIANYSTTTAIAIASSTGYVNTLLGSVIPLVPVFIPYIALILLLFRQFFLCIIAFTFTVFIAPTTMKFPATRHLALVEFNFLTTLASTYWYITIIIALTIFAIAYKSHGSLLESMATIVALGLAISIFIAPPHSLHAPAGVLSRLTAIASNYPVRAAAVSIAIAVLLLNAASRRNTASPAYPEKTSPMLITVIALIVAAIMLPYVYTIYPIPHHSDYYVGVLRSPWLPAEKIGLKSGGNYYGYTLSTSDGWFTVLLSKNRKIVYVPASQVVRQAVCETAGERKVPVLPPLITTFYARPPQIRVCADRRHLTVHHKSAGHPHKRPAPGPRLTTPGGRLTPDGQLG